MATSAIRVFDTLQILRLNLSRARRRVVYVEELDAFFEFDKDSSDADDGETIIKPTNLAEEESGRWIRKVSGLGGGEEGGDGGPPGTWTLLEKSSAALTNGQGETRISVSLAAPENGVIVAFVGVDDPSTVSIHNSTTSEDPAANDVHWAIKPIFGAQYLYLRAGSAAACTVRWAIYGFVPA